VDAERSGEYAQRHDSQGGTQVIDTCDMTRRPRLSLGLSSLRRARGQAARAVSRGHVRRIAKARNQQRPVGATLNVPLYSLCTDVTKANNGIGMRCNSLARALAANDTTRRGWYAVVSYLLREAIPLCDAGCRIEIYTQAHCQRRSRYCSTERDSNLVRPAMSRGNWSERRSVRFAAAARAGADLVRSSIQPDAWMVRS